MRRIPRTAIAPFFWAILPLAAVTAVAPPACGQYQIGPRPSYGIPGEPATQGKVDSQSLSISADTQERIDKLCDRARQPKGCLYEASFAVQVPNEMRDLVLGFLYQLGAQVSEGGLTDYIIEARTQQESVFVGVWRQKMVVNVEVRGRRPFQRTIEVLLYGRGEELYYGQDWARAVRTAGREALMNLR